MRPRVLRIEYNDGELGILVVSAAWSESPATIFEGITASKGFTDFWKAQPPTEVRPRQMPTGTLFHVGVKRRKKKTS